MIPYRLIAYGAAALVVVFALLWVGKRIRVSYQAEQERDSAVANYTAYRASVEAQARVAAAQRARDEAEDTKMAEAMDRLRNDNDQLRGLIAQLKPTVERTDANGNRSVAAAGLWWLCVSTAVSRDAADTAACQARASNGALPDPLGH